MRNTTFIYTLSCPISGDVRYVGKANNPRERYSKHNKMCDNNQIKNEWIKSLLDSNLKPVLTIIDEVKISQWKEMEKFYIKKYKDLGCKLTNISGGANGTDFGNQTSFDGSNARKIICLLKTGECNKIFDSIKDAKEFIGCNKNNSNINSVLKGKTKTAHGFIWLYESDYKNLSTTELDNIVESANNNMSNIAWKNGLINHQFKKGQKSLNKKMVHQYSKDGDFIKTWDSATDASVSFFGSRRGQGSISMCAIGDRKSAFGYKWSYNLLETFS
jgi:hypothetical protein